MTDNTHEPMPLLEALTTIRGALEEHGGNPPNPLPTTLDRKQIARMVSVFQPRELDGRWEEDERHVETLTAAIGKSDRPKYLDPVAVWWGGDRWYVIDGHHRLVAYDRAKVRLGIPVVVFEGTLDEAMADSAFANSKDRLIMRKDDKLNFAWKLTLSTELPKSRVVEVCAVANGSVGLMRNVKAKLLGELGVPLEELTNMTWTSARLLAEGKQMDDDYDPDAAVRKRADQYRKRLYTAFKDIPTRDHEAFGLALRLSNDRLPGLLMTTNAWSGALRNTVEDLLSELPGAEEVLEGWHETPPEDADMDY
jgi:hypothetical protein